jgi:deoxyribodipyrimidine photolyase-related protein
MPGYARLNVLDHQRGIPGFFWDGETHMQCVRQTMTHVLRHGYSHHIHRLMVMGLFALLAGVHPYRFHEWHMAMYTDAIDWVSLPNALGMSQYADGGIVGTKPYCASGQYINRMSDFCRGCPYDPRKGSGADACPYTTLYWHFLDRHHEHFKDNQRMQLQTRNLEKKRRSTSEMAAIRRRAEAVLSSL